jgi:hypothetical protein
MDPEGKARSAAAEIGEVSISISGAAKPIMDLFFGEILLVIGSDTLQCCDDPLCIPFAFSDAIVSNPVALFFMIR